MNQLNTLETIKTIYVFPALIGTYLDHSLGQEAPLFAARPVDKRICGRGYNSWRERKALGMPYLKTGKTTPYKKWVNMLERCYRGEKPAYQGCCVCPKWHDYQEFAAWYTTQPYAGMPDAELDKDVLDPLNTLYSPELCCVVPKGINLLFKDSRKRRGQLPKGVSLHQSQRGFVAAISKHGKQVNLGRFRHPIEAFEAYKQARQAYGLELAALYDGLIDPRVITLLRKLSAHIRD